MKAEPFAGCENLLRAPEGFDHPVIGKVEDIPCYIGQGVVMSVWRPTPEEAALLVGGGVLVLTVLGNSQPPISLGILRSAYVNEGMGRG